VREYQVPLARAWGEDSCVLLIAAAREMALCASWRQPRAASAWR